LNLCAALGITSGDLVAFVGAGGKSGAILALASELTDGGMKVLVAPTTKMFVTEAERVGAVVTAEEPGDLRRRVEEAFGETPAVVAGSGLLSKGRVGGVDPSDVPELASLADVTLVEADGSRRRPLKGTAEHEPVLPEGATLIVAVGNVEALGQRLDEENVHRPEVFSQLTGVGLGQSITPMSFARALVEGPLSRAPGEARRAALVTGAEPGRKMADAAVVTRALWRLGVTKVVLASLKDGAPPQVWLP
jgi:probable selenium-dependent hydroxylase accessory protein YqeC